MPLVRRPDGGFISGVDNLKIKEHRHWLEFTFINKVKEESLFFVDLLYHKFHFYILSFCWIIQIANLHPGEHKNFEICNIPVTKEQRRNIFPNGKLLAKFVITDN